MLTIDYGNHGNYYYNAIFFEDDPQNLSDCSELLDLPQKRCTETVEEIVRKRKNIVGLDDLHVEDFGDRNPIDFVPEKNPVSIAVDSNFIGPFDEGT